MLTVRRIAEVPELKLRVEAGAASLDKPVRWVHISELSDPTPWLEGVEFLLTLGMGVGTTASAQRAYLRRLAEHGLAGLGFALEMTWDAIPPAIVDEANRLAFPVLSVPYEIPFIAITKAAFTHLASDQLERITQALEVHERLAQAVIDGQGLDALLAILSDHLGCSLALVDETGRVMSEHHAAQRLPFAGALELPVVAGDEIATFKAVSARGEFGEYDRLVLHHGQTALAFELSRRLAVSLAELRLAGDLLHDLEQNRLEEREISRRMRAFGLEGGSDYAALLALPRESLSLERLRSSVAHALDRRRVRYLSTARPDRAAFLVEASGEEEIFAIARDVVAAAPECTVGVGRPSRGRGLGRSLLEARAALATGASPVASYRDLGPLELLHDLPEATLEAFVDRVLGPAAQNESLIETLTALAESGCRWSEAAQRLNVHRHTLRYRMERLREQTGRHPDTPGDRIELWLAAVASRALAARRAKDGDLGQ